MIKATTTVTVRKEAAIEKIILTVVCDEWGSGDDCSVFSSLRRTLLPLTSKFRITIMYILHRYCSCLRRKPLVIKYLYYIYNQCRKLWMLVTGWRSQHIFWYKQFYYIINWKLETAASYARARSLQQSLAASQNCFYTVLFYFGGMEFRWLRPNTKDRLCRKMKITNYKGNSPSFYRNTYIYL